MKKLEKLKLHNLEEICADEQKSMKGGGEWRTMPDGNSYWYVGKIEVVGLNEPPGGWASICPACIAYHQLNEHNPMGRPETPVWTPFGEFVGNTLPHILGSGGHINGNETYYTITLADGTIIEGEGGN